MSSNLRETSAQLAAWDKRADFYSRAEQVLGPLEGGTSQALTSFWNSWEALSQSPESMTSRDQVLGAGRSLVQSLNDAHGRVTGLRGDVALDMTATVTTVNDLASGVAHLNAQIKAARASGNTANDLLDRRDTAMVELSRLAGTQTTFDADGDARVTLQGLPLVDGDRADALVVSGSPAAVHWEATGQAAAPGGELGSLVELSGPAAGDLLNRLDAIALELRDLVNATHRTGFGVDGVDGRDFFSGTGAVDISLSAGLTNTAVAASTTGAAADGNHALALGGLRSAPGSGGQTVAELLTLSKARSVWRRRTPAANETSPRLWSTTPLGCLPRQVASRSTRS